MVSRQGKISPSPTVGWLCHSCLNPNFIPSVGNAGRTLAGTGIGAGTVGIGLGVTAITGVEGVEEIGVGVGVTGFGATAGATGVGLDGGTGLAAGMTFGDTDGEAGVPPAGTDNGPEVGLAAGGLFGVDDDGGLGLSHEDKRSHNELDIGIALLLAGLLI